MVHAVVRGVVREVPRFVSNLFTESLLMNKLITNRSMNKLRTNYPRTIIGKWFYEQITHETSTPWTTTVDPTVHHTCGRAVVRIFVILRYRAQEELRIISFHFIYDYRPGWPIFQGVPGRPANHRTITERSVLHHSSWVM